MSAGQYIADLLLGSPIPPPRWIDPRSRYPPPGGFIGVYPVPRGRFVSDAEIQVTLEEMNACVNPPLIQGWAWCLAMVGVAAVLFNLRELRIYGSGDGLAWLEIVMAPVVWCAAVIAGGLQSRDIELREGSVYVRRWTDVWFDREGTLIGRRSTVHAVLSCGVHLHLAGETGVADLSLRSWPSSSRRWLEKRFDAWNVELEFPGSHHAHHPAHWNHGQHRFAHRMPERRVVREGSEYAPRQE
jgi:hypothetical protein